MPRVIFTGYVTPDGFLRQAGRGPLILPDPALPNAQVTYAITDSRFVAECDLEDASNDSLNRLRLWVYHLIRENLDIVSFVHGIGLTLIVENCTLPDGTTLPIHSMDRTVAPLCTMSINEIIKLAELERSILKHIHDLAYTLSHPLEIPVNCGRAIDGIAKLISPDDDPKNRWIALRENLNLTREYVQLISDTSKEPRHGSTDPQSLPILYEVRNRSWTIVNRFLHFRKGGSVKLSLSEFPPPGK